MRRFLILFLLVSVLLSFITISLQGIPGEEFSAPVEKIIIYLDIAGEEDLRPLVKAYLLQAFSSSGNVNVVFEVQEGVSYVVSIVLVEARAGAAEQRTGNVVACVQYIDYFDNSILQGDVAVSNWERVNDLTANLIEHSQVGLHLFPKNDLRDVANRVVSKFQKLFLENHE